ncbi:hypothetical protein BSKO_04876 [Bryopsis sp. KO-2023]|nr:hypothetical protein BSKO_04876 [Bryopsis sp. KO-2023]
MDSRAIVAASLALIGALWVARPWRRRRGSQENNQAALSGRPTREEREPRGPPAEVPGLSNQEMLQVDLGVHRRLVEQLESLEVYDPEEKAPMAKTDLLKTREDLIQRVQHLRPGDPGASSWTHFRRVSPPKGGNSERRPPKSSDHGLSRAMVKDVGPWRVEGGRQAGGCGSGMGFFFISLAKPLLVCGAITPSDFLSDNMCQDH